MAEHVTSEQLIFFNIAAAMASIRFINVLEDKHIEVEPKFAEANTLTYGTRVDFENARVDLSLNVRKVFFSTYNKKELSDSFEKVSQIYPYLVKENLWKTNLENGNPEVHPGPTLLNVGRIDYADSFALYKEGITKKHTVRLLHAIELERLTLGRKLGFETLQPKSTYSKRLFRT